MFDPSHPPLSQDLLDDGLHGQHVHHDVPLSSKVLRLHHAADGVRRGPNDVPRRREEKANGLVGVRGFEPPAPASRRQCSARLSYTPSAAGATRPRAADCSTVLGPPRLSLGEWESGRDWARFRP